MAINDPIYFEITKWGMTLRQGKEWFWDRETNELLTWDSEQDAADWLQENYPHRFGYLVWKTIDARPKKKTTTKRKKIKTNEPNRLFDIR